VDKKIKFYTIYFEDADGNEVDINVLNFFKNLEHIFNNDNLYVPQSINGVEIYMFEFSHSDINAERNFIIPFGKRKTNVPYKLIDDNKKAITPYTEKLFDVNLLFYSDEYKVAIMTTDREGPSNKVITDLLNRYVASDEYCIKIKPILYEVGIENIRNSRRVKSIFLNINLDDNVEAYYREHINSNVSLMKGIAQMLKTSKYDANCKTFRLELGVGHYKDYIDFENAMALLNELNIANSDFINEVEVNYIDGKTEKIDTVKIKNSAIELYDKINHQGKGSLLRSELLGNYESVIQNKLYEVNNVNRIIANRIIHTDKVIEICRGEHYERLLQEGDTE